MAITFELNGEPVSVDAPGTALFLWVLRDRLNLTGTRYGCGMALCGSCTIHVDGEPARACVLPLSAVAGKSVTTIEGLDSEVGQRLKQAWIEEQTPQCGYCQSGQLMQAAVLLAKNPSPTREEIVAHMDPILCRCGTYGRILRAIEKATGGKR